MNGICPDLVQALQSIAQNEGDSEALRIALNDVDLLAVDPAGEMLMVMSAASVQVKNGRPQITIICQRVATGNEYRDWQQSGNVPILSGDAGSNPAVGAATASSATPKRELSMMAWLATEGGRKCPQCGKYAKGSELGYTGGLHEIGGVLTHISSYGHIPGYGCNRSQNALFA